MGVDYRHSTQIPSGVIVMWKGSIATIPTGWALCNGSNGTPDLRSKFIIAAKQDDGGVAKADYPTGNLNQSGGHATGSHIHTISGDIIGGGIGELDDGAALIIDGAGGSKIPTVTTSVTGSISAGEAAATTYMPPFYALAYIMKL